MTQHTPGPWEARSIGLGPARVYACGKGGSLIATPGYLRDDEQEAANALLIAGSPDLLAALRMALAQLEALGGRRRKFPSEGQDMLHADVLECIDTAIAKATGSAS